MPPSGPRTAATAGRSGVRTRAAARAHDGPAARAPAHLLATTRVIEPAGLGEKASVEWSDTNRRKAQLEPAKKEIEAIRERWAVLANEKFLEHGIEARIDHRGLAAQGIEREPTSHLGPAVSGLKRRRIETEVGKRLEREALEAAQRRIDRAAELRKLEREGRELTASILDVSGNIAAAKRERDLMLAPSPARSLEALQKEGRERWLAMRAERLAKEGSPEQGQSLETERQKAIKRWREYRRTQELEKGREVGESREREGPGKDLGRGEERDRLEFE